MDIKVFLLLLSFVFVQPYSNFRQQVRQCSACSHLRQDEGSSGDRLLLDRDWKEEEEEAGCPAF